MRPYGSSSRVSYSSPSDAGIEFENLLTTPLSREHVEEESNDATHEGVNTVAENSSHQDDHSYGHQNDHGGDHDPKDDHNNDHQSKDEHQIKASLLTMQTTGHIPWVLRQICLLGFFVAITSLIIILEVLAYISRRDQGLSTSTQNKNYLWKYGPTAVFSILATYWGQVEYHTKVLMPWKAMLTGPQPLEHSLLLDYVSSKEIVTVYSAAKAGDFAVAISILGSLTIIVMTVVSTSVFILQPTLVTRNNTSVSLNNRFDSSTFNSSLVDGLSVLSVSGILSKNLSMSYPTGTNQDYAVESFHISKAPAGSNVTVTAKVNVFSADLDCTAGRLVNATVEADLYDWSLSVNLSDSFCATGPLYLGSVRQKYEKNTTNIVGATKFLECSQANKFVIAIAQFRTSLTVPYREALTADIAYPDLNTTVLFCSPTAMLEEAFVTLDSTSTITGITLQNNSIADGISGWEMALAFNTSLGLASQMFLENNDIMVGLAPASEPSFDPFWNVLRSISSQQPDEKYLDARVLEAGIRPLYRASCAQIAKRFLATPLDDAVSGSYQVTQLRLVLREVSLRIMEAGLVVMMICTLVTMIIRPIVPELGDPFNLDCVATILGRSTGLMDSHRKSGDQPLAVLGKLLKDSTYSLKSHTEDGKAQSFWIQKCPKTGVHSQIVAQETKEEAGWWRPFASRKSTKAVLVTLPVILIAGLETIYQISQRSHGLGDIPESEYLHYTWTIVPALIMTATKILLQTAAFPIRLLDPFRALKEGHAIGIEAISRNYLSMNAPHLCYRSVMDRRYAVFGTALSALFTPFLTIVVSGLFDARYLAKLERVNISLADQLTSPSCVGWQQGPLTAANLLIKQDADYPKGTYANVLYPGMATLSSDLATDQSAETFNATSLSFQVTAHRTKMDCKVMRGSGFQYSLSVNDSRFRADLGSWSDGIGQYWLNLTHPDLAGCNCSSLAIANDEYCSKLPSMGTLMSPNSSNFSAVFDSQLVDFEFVYPTAWPDPSVLSDAMADPTTPCPDVTVIYGSWDKSSANITGVACSYGVDQVQADLTYDLPQTTISNVQVNEHSPPVALSPCFPFKDYSISKYLAETADNRYENLVSAVLNGSDASTVLTPANAPLVANRLGQIYETFTTQYLNTARQAFNTTEQVIVVPGTLVNANRQRLYQNEVSTRILEGLLAIIWICTVVAFAFSRSSKVVHKNPCSIAAQASLFADSEILHSMPETVGDGKVLRSLEAQGYIIGLGWRGQGRKNRTYGIDVGRADTVLI